MKTKYYTLFIQETDTLDWVDVFGSYDRDDVQEEREVYEYDPTVKKMKIMTNDGTHAGLMANYESL